ncbi:MAG: MMPL family transporter, partial [bacterium]
MLFLSRKGAERPKITFVLAGLTSLVLILLVALPTIFPGSISVLKPLAIDTDPENMLESDEPARIFHNRMKREFALYDMVVVGVINTDHPQGVFNVQTLRNVYELADHAGKLQWEKDGSSEGVVAVDLIAPSTVDNIEQAGPGTVRFEWLMSAPPATEEEALAVAKKARRIPFLDDTLISRDGKALALYIPITSKDISYEVASDLRKKIDSFTGKEQYHITGLPVAQDQFGLEMFKQMAISAPMAMLLIFGLMWLFFRHVRFIVSPMIVAMVAVIDTMGLLVVAGNTIHIMSSMIPIFIMPIAVLDSVHILSEFFDLYPRYKDRAKTLKIVMEDLNTPMLFTSLTTGVGFASLALTPIPPVQIFGIFVGIGVVLAWFLTITLVPAYIMMMPESSLEGFGSTHEIEDEETEPLMSRLLVKTGNFSFNRVKLIFIAVLLLGSVAAYGITRIQINDNPVKWFNSSHEIRVADRELNKRFGGTYMAYLTLSPGEVEKDPAVELSTLKQKLANLPQPARASLLQILDSSDPKDIKNKKAFIASLTETAMDAQDATDNDAAWDAWDEALLILGAIAQEGEIFKRPEVLGYIERLEESLQQTGLVGKSNSLPDIVKTVHRELLLGKEEEYRIPNTPAAVAQTLITYQNSHRPQDLWHFVTPDYRRTNLWLQLKSGDNIDMNAV